jgi:hypothetical protein
MTPTLLPAMAESAFRPLKERLESAPPAPPYTADEVREWLSACEFGTKILDHLRGWLREALSHGVERRKLERALTQYEDLIDSAGEPLEWLSSAVVSVLPEEEKARAQQSLQDLVTRAAARRAEVAALRELMARPLPSAQDIEAILKQNPVDPSRYESIEDLLARLKAGGDVCGGAPCPTASASTPSA